MSKTIDNKNGTDKEVLFEVDNTGYEVLLQFIFLPFAYLLMATLFLTVGHSDIQAGLSQSYYEFFVSQLSDVRFVAIMLVFLIGAPLLILREVRKIRQRDNQIYFTNDGLWYKDTFVPVESIKEIEVCWYCIHGGTWKYFLAYVLLGCISIPFKILEIAIFYYKKAVGQSDLKNLSYKFSILTDTKLANGSYVLYGYCYDEKTLQKLRALKK